MACILEKSPKFKSIVKAISTSLGVDVSSSDVKALLELFYNYNNMEITATTLSPKNVEKDGVIEFLENHYLVNRYMEVNSKEDYDAYTELFETLKDRLNVPIEDTEDNRDLADDMMLVTGNIALLVPLADGKIMIRVPAIKYKKNVVESNSATESNITFTTSKVGGSAAAQYHARTAENAEWSDITLALADNFNTAGESLTAQQAGSKDKKYLGRKTAIDAPDKYVPLDMKNIPTEEWAHEIISIIERKGLPTKNIKLNIAGNGIYSLSENQEYYDREVTALLKELQANGITIAEVRTGGQTGIDEAGAKAAASLGIKTEVHAPKDYLFKDAKGDKSGKAAFQERFMTKSEESGYKPYDSSLDSMQSPSAVKPTIESFEAEFRNMMENYRSHITAGKGKTAEEREADFRKNHKYYIDGKEVSTSVTSLVAKLTGTEFVGTSKDEAGVALAVGNAFDVFVRDYFNGGLKVSYDYIGAKGKPLYTELKEQLDTFKKSLDSRFSKKNGYQGYKVITEEFPIGGTYKGKLIAGTMDMVILAVKEDGTKESYIYDMKTTKHSALSTENIAKYSGQTSFYKALLEKNSPAFADTLKDTGLLVANVSYNGDYSNYEREDDVVKYKGKKLSPSNGNLTISINLGGNSTDKFIHKLTPSAKIEKVKKDIASLTDEDLMELASMPSGSEFSIVDYVEALKQQIKDAENEDKFGASRSDFGKNEVIDASNDSPVSKKEMLRIGRTIFNQLSMLGDMLVDFSTPEASAKAANLAKEIFGEDEKGSGNYFFGMDRKKLFADQQVFTSVIEYIKSEYFESVFTDPDNDIETIEQANYILDNWNAILNTAYNVLFDNEGLGLNANSDYVYVEELPEGVEIGQTDLVEANDISQKETDGREAYFIDSRTLSYINSAPKEIKRKLGKLYAGTYREDGTIIEESIEHDQFGIPMLKDKVEVINYLMNILHNCNTLSDMIAVMKEHATYEGNSWIYNVISEIENSPTSTFPSQFKVLFRKNKTKYNKAYYKVQQVFDEFGKPVTDDYGNEVKNKTVKTIPLDITDTVNRIMDDIYDSDSNKSSKEAKELKETLSVTSRKSTAQKVDDLKEALEFLGFPNIDNIDRLKNAKYRKSVKSISDSVQNILTDIIKNGYNYYDLCAKLYHLSSLVAPLMDARVEISMYDSGNSYMIYTEPTYLETLVSTLNNTNELEEEQYRKVLENKFLKYEQYARTIKGERVPYGGWLKKLYDNPKLAECIQHYVRTTFNGNDYAHCNQRDYFLSLLVDYCACEKDEYRNTSGQNLALYRVVMMSDKKAGESIQGFRIRGENLNQTKDLITEEASEFFYFELDRIVDVLNKLKDNNPHTDVEVFNIKRSKAKSLRNKLIKGEKLTIEDFAEKGELKSFIAGSGASFKFVPMLNDEIAKGTAFGKDIIQAINAKLYDSETPVAPLKLKRGFKTSYKKGMESEYKKFRDYAIGFLNPSDIVEYGVSDTVASEEKANELIEEFFWNDSLATMNQLSLTIVDPAFYKNSTDLQKRYAQVHSSTSKVNTEATFFDMDRGGVETKFSDGIHRSICIDDQMVASALAEETRKVFEYLYKKETDARKKAAYKHLMETVPPMFMKDDKHEGVNVTDGQAYGGPTSFWKKRNMLGDYDAQFDEAIEKIKEGDVLGGCCDLGLLDNLVNQPFKPFVYSVIARKGADGTERLTPTQMKDSEAMILLGKTILDFAYKDADGNEIKKSPLLALFQILEDTAYDEGGLSIERTTTKKGKNKGITSKKTKFTPRKMYNGRGIDTFVFKSAVKCGITGVIDINSYESWEDAYEDIMNKIYVRDAEGNIMLDENGNKIYNTDYVYEVPFEEWGKQQETPAHTRDHEQPIAVQGRVMSVANFSKDAEFTIKRNGKTEVVKRDEFLQHYFSNVAKLFSKGITKVKDRLSLDSSSVVEKNKVLSEMLKESLVKDAKYQAELLNAFSLMEDGRFPIEVGDPTISSKVFSVITSLIKKEVNNTKFQGGPIVQQSPFGVSDNLHIKYVNDDPTQGYEYFECLCTCPSEDIEKKMTNPDGSMKTIQEGLDEGIITEDDITILAERIPTEDKYSMYKMRIVGFLPRQEGEKIIMPKELTTLSGTDFDIDKMFVFFYFAIDSLNKQIHGIKTKLKKDKTLSAEDRADLEASLERLEDELDSKETANEILRCMLTAISHPEAMEKLYNPGNFDNIKELAAEVDESYKKDSFNLMYLTGQLYYHTQNNAGKTFVGIGALNNVAHCLSNIAELTIDLPFTFEIEGKKSYDSYFINDYGEFKIDQNDDLDGNRISRTLCSFIGAGADNAKDAVLKSVNITPTTANYAMSMLRMGIPLRTTVMILNHPLIKEATNRAELEAESLDKASFEFTNQINGLLEQFDLDEGTIDNILASTNITADAVKNRMKSFKSGEYKNIDIAVVAFMYKLAKVNDTFSALSSICQLNSTKNAVGPDEYATRKTEYILKETLDAIDIDKDVLDRKVLFTDSIDNLFYKVPYLVPLVYCYTGIPERFRDIAEPLCGSDWNEGLMPRIGKQFSPLYSEDMTKFLDMLISKGKSARQFNDKALKKILNAYLVYKATYVGAIDGSEKHRKDLILQLPTQMDAARKSITNDFVQAVRTKKKIMDKKNVQISGLQVKITSISRDDKDDIGADWEALAESGAREKKLSDNIFEYMMMSHGFTFHPQSGISLATSKIKRGYKENAVYNDIMNNNISIFEDEKQFMNFLIQYVRNTADKSLVPTIGVFVGAENYPDAVKRDKSGKGYLVDRDYYENVYGSVDLGIRIYEEDKTMTYFLAPDSTSTTLHFVPYYRLGDANLLEYNAKEDGTAMTTINNKAGAQLQKAGKKYVDLTGDEEAEENEDSSASDDTNESASQLTKIIGSRGGAKEIVEKAKKVVDNVIKKEKPSQLSRIKRLGKKAGLSEKVVKKAEEVC